MSETRNVVIAAFVGAAVGAIAGLLLAPASGEETRKNLGKKVDDLGDSIQGLVGKLRHSADDLEGQLRTKAREVVDNVKAKAESTSHN